MFGAILGDIIGSPYEFDRGRKTKEFPLFCDASEFTDDTVMTIAVAEALMDADENMEDEEIRQLLVSSMRKWGKIPFRRIWHALFHLAGRTQTQALRQLRQRLRHESFLCGMAL